MIRFLADASLHDAIVTGCLRREPAIDFLLKPVAVSRPPLPRASLSCLRVRNSAPPRLALYSLTESARSPFHAEPTHHPNVRVAIFAILVEIDVDLDDAKWEADFSFRENQPEVWTRIFRNS